VPHDGLHNDHDGDDSCTGLSWIEIDPNGLRREKQASLVATEVLQKRIRSAVNDRIGIERSPQVASLWSVADYTST